MQTTLKPNVQWARAAQRRPKFSCLLPSTARAALVFVCLASSPWAGIHEDTKHGFKISIPRGWTEIPIQLDEEWIIAKYICEKEDRYNDPTSGYTRRFTPELRVIAFTDDHERESVYHESETENKQTRVVVKNDIYRDYKDYKRNSARQGGFHFSKEDTAEVDDIPVDCYEIMVERMSRSGPKRVVAWVYHLDDRDIAVEFTVVDDCYDDHRRAIRSTLKSFETIEREAVEDSEKPLGVIEEFALQFDLEDLTPKEREEARQHLEEIAHARAIEQLPDDWRHRTVGRCLVLTHDTEDYGRDVAEQCNAVLKWLDKNLYYIGPDEYVRSPIIRVCKDREEETAFRKGTDWSWGISTEIVTHKEIKDWFNVEDSYVNERILQIWFEDRDKELYWSMPLWLRTGLLETFATARAKGSRLDFKDRTDIVWLRAPDAELIPASELLRAGSGSGNFFARRLQAGALVKWLLVGRGSRSSKTKNVFADYMINLKAVVDRIKAEEKQAKDSDKNAKPKTEEQEAERFREKRNAWEKKRDRITKETFELTFADWDDDDWKRFDTMFLKTAE